MVLYKRKPVVFSRPLPLPEDLSQEVFFIPVTKEWFYTYEEYLQKLDYYNRRKFVCEITGNSCLTFFSALESESKEIEGVDKKFPEALREHILRFLQFNRITRLDQLVDKVYSSFKNEYYPGETVYLKGSISSSDPIEGNIRQRGTIKEKIQYSNPADGAFTKYLIVRLSDMKESIVGSDKISRNRNNFTKWLIKTFIKLTMTRSHKVGAPWVVKKKYATIYNIPQKYPDDLKQYEGSTPSGEILYGDGIAPNPPSFDEQDKKQGKKGSSAAAKRKNKLKQKNAEKEEQKMTAEYFEKTYPLHHSPKFLDDDPNIDEKNSSNSQVIFQKRQPVSDLSLQFNLQFRRPYPKFVQLPSNAGIAADMERDTGTINDNKSSFLKNVQQSLESWVFLNIYHRVLYLDTFTYDDFIYAMGWNLDQFQNEGRCQLLDEIWCAVLGAIVSNKSPGNSKGGTEDYELLINIDSLEENNESELEDTSDIEMGDEREASNGFNEIKNESSIKDSTVEQNFNGNGIKEDVGDEGGNPKSEEDAEEIEEEIQNDPQFEHQAYQAMNYRGKPWYERLRKRNFRDGNWQCILLGVLSLLENIDTFRDLINRVFKTLCPLDQAPTPASVLSNFYKSLHIDDRLGILNILTTLLIDSKLVRNYIDECLETSTSLRRNRLDLIRDYKATWETAQKLNIEIKELLQTEKDNAKGRNKSKTASKESKSKSKSKTAEVAAMPDSGKKRPKLNLESLEMTTAESQLSLKSKEFRKLWDSRKASVSKINELKQQRRDLEKQLNELDCQRVKLLGKDRFFNRYWWFESNGLPTLYSNSEEDEEEVTSKEDESDKNEDISDETYLMGRLWVQGPSNDDLRIHFGLDKELADKLAGEVFEFASTIDYEVLNSKQKELEGESVNIHKPHEIKFSDYPEELKIFSQKHLNIKFDSDFVSRTYENSPREDVVLNQFGGLTTSSLTNGLGPLQRKLLEEAPAPSMNGSNWKYYDDVDCINRLIEWLNPWGARESQLKKELMYVRDAIEYSIEARRHALGLNVISNSLDQLPSTKGISDANIDNTVEDEVSNPELTNEDPNKRNSVDEDQHISKRQKIAENVTPNVDLFVASWDQPSLQRDRDLQRVLEWVNSCAIEVLDKSLYEGGDKPRMKNGRR